MSENKYVILMETNGEEYESWLYFLKYNGNEENIAHLNKQLEMVNWTIIDDMSTFDMDLEHLVSETTAREMCMVDLNAYSFHRMFNGTLKRIDFRFKSKDKNKKKIYRVFKLLGYGQIDNFIDKEIVDGLELDENADLNNSDDSDDSGDSEYETVLPSMMRESSLTD